MPHVQIHCYGCDARTTVNDTSMGADLRYAGWSVTKGETYCRACSTQRGLEQGAADASIAGDPAAPPPAFAGTLTLARDESRLTRTLRLMSAAVTILRRDPRLLIFPGVAIVANLVFSGAGIAIAFARSTGPTPTRHSLAIWGIVASFPATYTTLFCGVALACMLSAHLDGITLDMSQAWRAAAQRADVILAWTLLVCTVGLVIRVLEQRVPRFLLVIIDLAWVLMTLFAVPVLAYEQLGPIATFRRSRQLLGQRWPEQIGGAAGLGIASALLALPFIVLIAVGFAAGEGLGVLLIVLGGIGLFVVVAAQAAAEQVFRICLYRFAVGQDTAGTFDPADLAHPFVRRRRSR